MDKSKFTRDPQLDSEGFTLPDARCYGCAPREPLLRYLCFESDPTQTWVRPVEPGKSEALRRYAEANGIKVITLGSDPWVPRDQFGRRYLHDSRGRYIGLERR